jgi:7-carboxy-7-deazaguanine synthase
MNSGQTPARASLRITEIFVSLQGEARHSGLLTTFVRLTGCPLRCVWCDTAYAFHGGQQMTLSAILDAVAEFGAKHVCVTGGEPLAQPGCEGLLSALCMAGYNVSLETSGALSVEGVDNRVLKVMDIKAPGSGEAGRNRYDNLQWMRPSDQIKFVLADRRDYDWARMKLDEPAFRACPAEVLFSPVWETLPPAELADWIVEDRLSVRFQLQLHKVLWRDEPGR